MRDSAIRQIAACDKSSRIAAAFFNSRIQIWDGKGRDLSVSSRQFWPLGANVSYWLPMALFVSPDHGKVANGDSPQSIAARLSPMIRCRPSALSGPRFILKGWYMPPFCVRRSSIMARLVSITMSLLCMSLWVFGQTSSSLPASAVFYPDTIAPDLANSTVSSTTAPVFRKPIFAFVASPGPEAIKVADLDKNGHPDIITAVQNHTGRGVVSVTLGLCCGHFRYPTIYDSGGYWAQDVAVADLNHDGKLDLAVANYGCSAPEGCTVDTGIAGVLLGNGDGTFKAAVPYHVNDSSVSSIAIADLNKDGNPDLIVGSSRGVSVLLGNGDGTFQTPTRQSAGTSIVSVAVADLNGDGKLDVVAASQPFGLGVLLGKGDGTFNTAVLYKSGVSTGGWPNKVVLADLNDDGIPDLAAANYPDHTVGVLLNHGDGTFTPAVTYDVGVPLTVSLAAADVNADLKRDLVVVNYGTTVSVLLANGDGTFQAPLVYPLFGPAYNSIAIADMNGNRSPDVILLDGSSAAQVLMNITSSSVATTTTMTSSTSSSVAGQPITLQAMVSSPLGSPPSGESVIFKDGSHVLGTVALVKGSASLAISSLQVGTHNLSAHYPGDIDFLRPSTSLYLKQVVTAP